MDRRTARIWRWLPLAAVCVAAAAHGVDAQAPMYRKTGQELPFVVTTAMRTSVPPVLDGKLDDACWTQAAVAGEFVLISGKGPATEQTDARVLWDNSNLYIGMRCFDSSVAKLKRKATERDGAVYSDDCVEIFFIPPDNPVLAKVPEVSARYFHMAVNAAGICADEIGLDGSDRWNGPWTARTSLYQDHWEVELAIPWSALQGQPTDGDVWSINFNRGFPPRDKGAEYSGWSLTFSGFHDPDHFGKMIFLDRWAKPGIKIAPPRIVARIVRDSELDPLLERLLAALSDTQAKLRALGRPAGLRRVTETLGQADQLAREVNAWRRSLDALPPPQLLDTWEALKGRYEKALRSTETLAAKAWLYTGLTPTQLRGREPIPDFKVFVLPPITNVRMLPWRAPTHALPDRTITLTACPREYESANFGICALADLSDVRLAAGDLTGPAGTIPASALDLRVVKVWYQSGRGVRFENMKVLTPELLLKDDSLVRIDNIRKINILKMDKDAMRDADTLQPFAVPAGNTKQCWVTVHVPAGAKAGAYRGAIRITTAGRVSVSVPVSLRVLPFELDEPDIICSIYYRAMLGTGKPKCNSERKTEEQLLAEFKDMLAHGVVNPTVYQRPGPDLARYLDLREQAGMHGGPLLFLGGFRATTAPALIDMAKKRGFSDMYFYGRDERRGDELRAQRSWHEAVHAVGGKTFVAGYKDSYEIVGDLLDMPILARTPNVEIGQAFHAMGHLIGSYANPQGGVEEPETYRRNFGLLLWKVGYDCACTYSYQHSFGHSWNDFDHGTYRDHEMAYPTVNGVIPTIQWEGYREGYDDLRYLATLENLIAKTKRLDGPMGETARAAHLWVLRIDPEATPLDNIRAGIIEHILAVRAARGSGTAP